MKPEVQGWCPCRAYTAQRPTSTILLIFFIFKRWTIMINPEYSWGDVRWWAIVCTLTPDSDTAGWSERMVKFGVLRSVHRDEDSANKIMSWSFMGVARLQTLVLHRTITWREIYLIWLRRGATEVWARTHTQLRAEVLVIRDAVGSCRTGLVALNSAVDDVDSFTKTWFPSSCNIRAARSPVPYHNVVTGWFRRRSCSPKPQRCLEC